MDEENKYQNWTDIIDQKKYDRTGIALLYRNPKVKPSTENVLFDPSIHLYSLESGDNYIFDQEPIAFGFTAYIGHEEIKSGENSLRSNRKNGNLGYQTLDYYRNYCTRLFERYSINDKKKAKPKPNIDLQVDFYSELLIVEEKHLELSEKFYSESQNEDDHKEKADLKEYVDAFFEWIEEKLIDLNPNENQIKGLGGLRDIEARHIFKEFKGVFIHSKTKQEHFIGIFQNRILPDGWERIEWFGQKAALFFFMDQVFMEKVKSKAIKKYFKVKDDSLLAKNRTGTDNSEIKEILEYAKTLRSRK